MSGESPPVSCNNYSGYNIVGLSEILASEDDGLGWTQVRTWAAIEASVREQRKRLAACITSLEEKWGDSEAASVFVNVMKELVVHMDTTTNKAANTSIALGNVMQALADAKKEIEPLVKKYQAKSGDLTPRFMDHAEDEINQKGWEIMARTDRAVESQVTKFQAPDPYQLLGQVEDPKGDRPHGSRGAGAGGGAGGAGGLRGDAVVPPIPHSPPVPAFDVPGGPGGGAPIDPIGADGSGGADGAANPGSGPDLAGAPPIGGPGLPGDPILPGPPLPPGLPPGPPPGGLPPIGGGGPPGGGPIGPFALPPTPTGLLGPVGTPPGTARPGRTASNRPGGARAMPPGGVIGGPLSGQRARSRRPGGRGGAARAGAAGRGGVGAMPGVIGGRGRPGDPEETELYGDPDNPWEVAEGVPPVIGPADGEQWHDPGPGVIGMGS